MEEVSGTRVTGWVDVGPDHLQPGSIVHGGLYAAVVEEAASYGASIAVRDRGQRVVGVANSTNFIRSVTGGRILVEAVPLQQGRTQQLWEVRMTRAEDGALVALGQLRLQNLAAPLLTDRAVSDPRRRTTRRRFAAVVAARRARRPARAAPAPSPGASRPT